MLGLAAIVTKLLGTLQKIPLQNIGGDGVFGIYNTVYPFYTLIITLAMAGFPTAVAKFVAEREAAQDSQGTKEVLRVSVIMMLVLGVAAALVLYLGAPLLAHWIGSSQVALSLRAAAPALLFVPLQAVLRGYFQGRQDMMPTAISQVTEQMVRVAFMITLLFYFTQLGAGDSEMSAGAIAGSAAGGLAGLIVTLLYWGRHTARAKAKPALDPKAQSRGKLQIPGLKGAALLKQMLLYALPICLAALAVPLLSLADTFTLPRLLQQEGMKEAEALIQIGVYNRGMPLVQLVAMLATSLSVLFIPAMAELKVKGDLKLARLQAGTAMRWFWLIGGAASVGLAVLAEPINVMLYADTAGSGVLRWVALSAAPAALVTVSTALLQGLGSVMAPAVYLVLAALLKIALNLALVPHLGITGAAIAGTAAYVLAAVLNAALLSRRLSLRAGSLAAVPRSLAALAIMAAAVLLLRWGCISAGLGAGRLAAAAEGLAGVLLGAVVFVLAALRLDLIRAAELAALPRVGPKLVSGLRRLGLLPKAS